MVGAGMVSRAGERTNARGHSIHTNDCREGLMPSTPLNGQYLADPADVRSVDELPDEWRGQRFRRHRA